MQYVLIAFHSQQVGNTAKMAELVAQGVRQVPDVGPILLNLNQSRVDTASAEGVAGYALGSPNYYSYIAGGLKQFFDDLYIAQQEGRKVGPKPYVAFCSHGGGGAVLDCIDKLARSLKLKRVAPGVACQGAPQGEAMEQCISLGRALAEHVAAAG